MVARADALTARNTKDLLLSPPIHARGSNDLNCQLWSPGRAASPTGREGVQRANARVRIEGRDDILSLVSRAKADVQGHPFQARGHAEHCGRACAQAITVVSVRRAPNAVQASRSQELARRGLRLAIPHHSNASVIDGLLPPDP